MADTIKNERWAKEKGSFAKLLKDFHKNNKPKGDIKFGELLGVSDSTIRSLERQEKSTPNILEKIFRFLNLSQAERTEQFPHITIKSPFGELEAESLHLRHFIQYVNGETEESPTTYLLPHQVEHDPKSDMTAVAADSVAFPVSTKRNAEYPLVAVCFVDIRGFTNFAGTKPAEGKIDQVLACLFLALNKALDRAQNNIQGNSDFARNILQYARTPVRKPLGDGAMLVWDYPLEGGKDVETGFDLFILDFAGYLQGAFYENLKQLDNRRGIPSLKKLHLGIGLSKGQAWKLYQIGSTGIDYIGNTINEAHRLQDVAARPHGIVAHVQIAPNFLMERFCFDEKSHVCQTKLNGIDKNPSFWMKTDLRNEGQPPDVHERMGWRCPRQRTTNEPHLGTVNDFLKYAYDFEFVDSSRPLTEHDTVSIFDLRAKLEARFAADLAIRVRDGQIVASKLSTLSATIPQMQGMILRFNPKSDEWKKQWRKIGEDFHSEIARLSNPQDGKQRKHFTEQAYEKTRRLYKFATKDELPSFKEIISEHGNILNAILVKKNPDLASKVMEDHLTDHYTNARNVLFVKPPAMLEYNTCPMKKQCSMYLDAKRTFAVA